LKFTDLITEVSVAKLIYRRKFLKDNNSY